MTGATRLFGPVLVVGSGLMGASLGLALRRHGIDVHLRDRDAETVRVAVTRGAGDADPPRTPPQVVVVAVPPALAPGIVTEALVEWPQAVVTDLTSVKAPPLAEVARRLQDAPDGSALARYVGSHPMAGSERSGALAASGDLFDGRAWAVTPHEGSDPDAVAVVAALVRRCGAELVTMTPRAHDAAVARISHLPHVLAVLAAARLHGAPDEELLLSGQGLRDVTRVAAGDPALWQQILAANASSLRELLRGVRADLDTLIEQLAGAEPDVVPLLERGVAGTEAIPGKHGGPARWLDTLYVVVPDEPGQLARLFADAGAAGVNIEDVRIDHDLGRPSGLVELAVGRAAVQRLAEALAAQGWTVHR